MDADRKDAEFVVRKLRQSGHVAYFAGGCVRDLLLGIAPKDWDVATDALPNRVREIFPKTQAVGAKFGVILVRQNSSVIEVATFRTDVSYEDGRHPTEVKFTTAEEDAKRRDFTINGLFLDPTENDKIIDYVGGQEDLKSKVLRAIGDPNLRFEEDHLRMLRAVRFAARFSLNIEPATSVAINRHALELRRISPERVAEELRMMLAPPTRGAAYVLLRRFELLAVIFRFSNHVLDLPREVGSSLFLTLSAMAATESISFGLALATIALDLRMLDSKSADPLGLLAPGEIKQARRALRQALLISNHESDAIVGILSFGHLIADAPASVAVMKRFLAKTHSRGARLLMAAIADLGIATERINATLARLLELETAGNVAPPPLLTGDDLVAAGFHPGPAFRHALDAVYDAQLEDRIKSKEQAMALARKRLA